MFQGNMSRPALVARLLSSTEVKNCGHLFPRACDFDDLSEASQSNIVEVMTSIAIGVARKLLPMDAEQGAGALLKRMTDNTTFKRFALPNIAVDSSSEESYVQFTQNPVVLAIKTALETLGTKDQKHRFSLASLLSMYPQDWVTRYVDKLGKTTMRNAKDKSGQESSDVNLLLLSDRLRDCHSNHLR
jgi:hypothetical protein